MFNRWRNLRQLQFHKRSLKFTTLCITNAEVLLLQYVDSQNFVSDYIDNNTVDFRHFDSDYIIITIDLGHLGQ